MLTQQANNLLFELWPCHICDKTLRQYYVRTNIRIKNKKIKNKQRVAKNLPPIYKNLPWETKPTPLLYFLFHDVKMIDCQIGNILQFSFFLHTFILQSQKEALVMGASMSDSKFSTA